MIDEHLGFAFFADSLRKLTADLTGVASSLRLGEPESFSLQFKEVISRHDLVNGAGLILSPDHQKDSDSLFFWYVEINGELKNHRFNSDPNSTEYYDYIERSWFTISRDHGESTFMGPYLDYLGVDEHIVTATVPLIEDGEFRGVVGADLSSDFVEEKFLTFFRHAAKEMLLVGSNGRIIASNSIEFVAGDRAPANFTGARLTDHSHTITLVSLSERPVEPIL